MTVFVKRCVIVFIKKASMNDFSLANKINFLKEQCLTNCFIALRCGLGISESFKSP